MLINKCYITAKYKEHTNDFVHITLNNAQYLLYIGNFKNTDKIITKLEKSLYLNAICRVRSIYEPEYPTFNSRIDSQLHEYLNNKQLTKESIWLEAIKITTLPEAKLGKIEEKGFFTLQDTYKNLYPYILQNKNINVAELTPENQQQLVIINGTTSHNHNLMPYKILDVKGNAKKSENTKQKMNNEKNRVIPSELEKFFST